MENKNRDISLFGQKPSLLFQFVLAEFLETFLEIQQMEKTYKEMESLLIKRRLLGDIDYLLNHLLSSVAHLTGSDFIDKNMHPWDNQKGCLSKLKQHCYAFVKARSNAEKTIANLDICISRSFHSVLQTREVIQHLQQEMHKGKPIPDYATLYQLLDRSIDNVNRAARLILQILLLFREDENVIYFLLRNKEKFNMAYKTAFLPKIFRKMYPNGNGVEEVGQLLMKKYSERGFKNLLNTIAQKISELELA